MLLRPSPVFTQRAVLHKKCVINKHHVVHKNHVLAGPLQGLFATYRIALSMVAGGTHRRRLNIPRAHINFEPAVAQNRSRE